MVHYMKLTTVLQHSEVQWLCGSLQTSKFFTRSDLPSQIAQRTKGDTPSSYILMEKMRELSSVVDSEWDTLRGYNTVTARDSTYLKAILPLVSYPGWYFSYDSSQSATYLCIHVLRCTLDAGCCFFWVSDRCWVQEITPLLVSRSLINLSKTFGSIRLPNISVFPYIPFWCFSIQDFGPLVSSCL